MQSLRRSTERDRSAELGDLGRVRYHASEKARLDRPERVLQVPFLPTSGVTLSAPISRVRKRSARSLLARPQCADILARESKGIGTYRMPRQSTGGALPDTVIRTLLDDRSIATGTSRTR